MIGDREFALLRPGARVVNCARGGIVDEAALYRALKSGKVAGAALDVFSQEPPQDRALLGLPNVVVTPHLGASTEEAQVAVACEAARIMIEALVHGHVEHAVNMPTVAPSEEPIIAPYLELAESLGSFASQLVHGRLRVLRVTYSGAVSLRSTSRITQQLTMGVLRPIVDEPVNVVNSRVLAAERGVQIEELKSTETGDFSTLITVGLTTDREERTVRGTLFGKDQPRLVEVDGFEVDAIPRGELLVIFDRDRPGLIGEIGRLLGSQGVNIARMTFGRKAAGGEAITVLNLDKPPAEDVLKSVGQVESVYNVRHIHLGR
jgi:D-3-phosphoglycerate dehydrogenase